MYSFVSHENVTKMHGIRTKIVKYVSTQDLYILCEQELKK
jgi:hypothetical protein